MDSEENVSLGEEVSREEKLVFGRWAIEVLSQTELWSRVYGPIQDDAINTIYGRLIQESNEDILEVIDLAFADLIVTLQGEAKLDDAMDLVSLDPTLLKMDPGLTEQLRRASLDQARYLMLLTTGGKAAEARGLLKPAETAAT